MMPVHHLLGSTVLSAEELHWSQAESKSEALPKALPAGRFDSQPRPPGGAVASASRPGGRAWPRAGGEGALIAAGRSG
jgi:hypothetical protein